MTNDINVDNLEINRVETMIDYDRRVAKLVCTCRSHLQKGHFRFCNSQESARDSRSRPDDNLIKYKIKHIPKKYIL